MLTVRSTAKLFVPFSALFLVALYYLYQNFYNPVQRDGSHFLYTTINILGGQSPYWAVMDTKNPLVEYFWSLFVLMLRNFTDVVGSARIAEHVYLLLTACGIYLIIRSYGRCANTQPVATAGNGLKGIFSAFDLFAFALALFYLCLVCDGAVTNAGFNIALYQTLPELAAIALLLKYKNNADWTWGVLLGIAIFAAWFVKQTSLAALAFPCLAFLLFRCSRRSIALLATAAATVLSLLSLWLGYLISTGTLDYYFLSSIALRSSQVPTLLAHFPESFIALITPFHVQEIDDVLRHFYFFVLYAAGLCLLFIPFALVRCCNRKGDVEVFTILVMNLWFFGSILSSLAGMTLYAHYFLANIGPLIALIGIAGSRWLPKYRYFVIAPILIIASILMFHYKDHRDVALKTKDALPLNFTVKLLRSVIPDSSRVYMWGGVLHYQVAVGRPSDYPQNVIWLYSRGDMSDDERDGLMQAKFKGNPPDYFIEMYETYPPWENLHSIHLTPDILRRWTNESYELVSTINPPPGPYSIPANVFKRVESSLTQEKP